MKVLIPFTGVDIPAIIYLCLKTACPFTILQRTMFLRSIVFCLICQLFWLFAADLGSAAGPKRKAIFKEVTATTSDTHLLIFCTLENSFTPEMTAILHSGIALKYSFFIELYKTAENWPDEQVITLTFQHVLSYDTLKENYRITLEEDNNKVLSFKSLAEAQKVLNELNGAKVIVLKQLIPDNRYKLKIRAELYQKTLPLSLHDVLPFLSWGDVATDWHSIEFQY
ncbi:MAG: DUF4390 domain-containing protein [Proteobacteria bacterium]|nr:DUF4390 domain-containing protein [Pseudomonadota bacterium]